MQNKIKDYIDNVYRDEAAKILPMRIRELSRIHKLPFFKLSLRNNVSRWGSCSSENNINLNIHLMRLPDYLIDYVLLHELTHTIIKDHSRKFWDYLSKICPNLDKCRREMKNYSTRTYSPN
jgi:predicted metal-dependent hydrolase